MRPPMKDLEGDGYALADIVLARHQCEHITSSLPSVTGAGRGGVRNLITHPTVVQLLVHERFGSYVWSVIGRDLVAVKATLFDKTAEANWRVQWHQDRTIPVREKRDVAGYGPWSMKAGVPHVEAPPEVLAQMLSIRIHLDDSDADTGPLRVIPGSHLHGKLVDAQLASIVAKSSAVELCAPQGGLLLMRPLLVHSSSAARSPDHRRVLHIELAPPEAISPLHWHAVVPLRRAA
jgi:ectoine hydroxylase-related dioxygenase (phytanoyl-CoA dioxygenase family)